MTYDNEAIVRHAYHTTEGSVLDAAGFVGSFAEHGVINLGHSGIDNVGYARQVQQLGADSFWVFEATSVDHALELTSRILDLVRAA